MRRTRGQGGALPGSFAAALVAVGLLTVSPAGAANRGSADIQWAQQALKERGFEIGRPNGELDAKTKAALSAFQKSVGLRATGALDPATIARLLEGRPAAPTMGQLTAPKPGQTAAGGGTTARPGVPAPQAAVRGSVATAGGASGASALGSVVRPGGGAPIGPVLQAVPRGEVAAAPSGAPASSAQSGSGVDAGEPFALVMPRWGQSALFGVIGATLMAFGALWWRSGRRAKPPRTVAVRLEPRLGSDPDDGRTALRAPRLR